MKHLLRLTLVFTLMVAALPAHTVSQPVQTAGEDTMKPWPPHGGCPICPFEDTEQVSGSGSLDWPPHDDCPICPSIDPRQASTDWPPHWPWPEGTA
ncbi:hypothetical protein [Deinococcus cellulosilyticus]|uniref:Uncharacterized protein n=1 Tax=Deinococcus cellulosilyticus (strain DSM 18568 / NBRC 106333 / KACC 11606 / 5516J-15) TaxID=1223518 RepID=A0A511N230_DEIC1|nr:hypothetical protein [Deinococcus cellulosilyticus]GEM46914.1 hypothetical protein DC3_25490 [Deinococcus cellulosilyticus NBRC 106333 = KACC 11606]